MELINTIYDMISGDYKRRFIAEYKQLVIRINKLDNIINKSYDNLLDFTSLSPIGLLECQVSAMKYYKLMLEKRAEYEGINLEHCREVDKENWFYKRFTERK